MEDILREPVELIDQDLDEVTGALFNINNFDSNQGLQVLGAGAFNRKNFFLSVNYLTLLDRFLNDAA